MGDVKAYNSYARMTFSLWLINFIFGLGATIQFFAQKVDFKYNGPFWATLSTTILLAWGSLNMLLNPKKPEKFASQGWKISNLIHKIGVFGLNTILLYLPEILMKKAIQSAFGTSINIPFFVTLIALAVTSPLTFYWFWTKTLLLLIHYIIMGKNFSKFNAHW